MSETQLDRLERKFDLFVEYVQARFESIEGEIAELRAEVGTLRAEVGTLRAEVGTLRAEVGTLRGEVRELRNELNVFRVETREKLENVGQRLTLLERSHITMTGDINDLRAGVEDLRLKLSEIGTTVLGTNMRLLELRDDMQQRFRFMNDRLTSLEKKLAA